MTQAEVDAYQARIVAQARASLAASPKAAARESAPEKPNATKRMQALGRLKPGVMNKSEQAYSDHLEALKHSGEIVWFAFEAMKFRLADNTFYTPDFIVMLPDGALEAHEFKGFWTDDARVKIKCAAEKFPIQFIAIKKQSQKDGGGYSKEYFK